LITKPLLWRRELCYGPDHSNSQGDSSVGAQPFTNHGAKTHRRRSLQSGRLHEHIQCRPKPNQLDILIDRGPSFRQLLSDSGLRDLSNHLKKWCSRSSVRLNLHHGPAEHSWGPYLWQHWSNQTKRTNGVLLVISDLHGPLPSGPFWRQWLSSRPIAILQVWHTAPQTGHAFLDIQNPSRSKRFHFRDELDLIEKKEQWQQAWQKWSRGQAVVHEQHQCSSSQDFILATQQTLSYSAHPKTTV
jgi:hypothetical protein